jgi:hypothetical protein
MSRVGSHFNFATCEHLQRRPFVLLVRRELIVPYMFGLNLELKNSSSESLIGGYAARATDDYVAGPASAS